MNANQLDLFAGFGVGVDPPDQRGMHRSTDKAPAREAAIASLPVVEANRRLILRLLTVHESITMFCPYVLAGHQYRQTVVGPRFPSLERSGLIECIGKRRPVDGAESSRLVSAFVITPKGRDYLARADSRAGVGCVDTHKPRGAL